MSLQVRTLARVTQPPGSPNFQPPQPPPGWGQPPLTGWDSPPPAAPQPPAPAQGPSRRDVILYAVAGVLAVTLIVVGILWARSGSGGATPPVTQTTPAGPGTPAITPAAPRSETPPPSADVTTSGSPTATEPTWYEAYERPGYQTMVEHVETVIGRYEAARDAGTLNDLVNPGVTVDDDYTTAFLHKLTDISLALRWGSVTGGTDPHDVDNNINAVVVQVDQLEQKFLAGEDLGFTVRIVRADGTVFESDGTAPTPASDDPEAWARRYVAQPDASGDYRAAGEEVAAAFGMTVSYGFAAAEGYCTKSPDQDTWAAMYCPATPSVIYINAEHTGMYPDYYSQPRYVDTIRHEISHGRIHALCGTISPSIAGGRKEAATNSYAVLLLGADFERLQMDDPDNAYYMTEASHDAAEAIAAGTCG